MSRFRITGITRSQCLSACAGARVILGVSPVYACPLVASLAWPYSQA